MSQYDDDDKPAHTRMARQFYSLVIVHASDLGYYSRHYQRR